MRRFAALFESLDTTTSTRLKIEAMADYFRSVEPADAAWAVYVLMGRRVKRSVGPALLHTWLSEEARLPQWLVEETYGSIGDLAETIALLVAPEGEGSPGDVTAALTLTDWFEQRILPLADLDPTEQRRLVIGWWHELPYRECFLVNKLLTGSLRIGVSRALVTRALAQVFGHDRTHIERALIGAWNPSASFWQALAMNEGSSQVSHPYPFYLASPLEGPVESLGERSAWQAEWKWDGIRGQIVRRAQECTLWSRGEEIITDRFPEIVVSASALAPGTVLDGEVLAWAEDEVLPFAMLQRRIGRRTLSPKMLKDVPARFLAYDLLEWGGEDWRPRPLRERRAQLQALIDALRPGPIGISSAIDAASWASLAALRDEARTRGVEGLMLKDLNSAYGTGRQRGAWWKWKIDPHVFDGVLLYAAPGHGRRSNLYTDYTFGVWSGDALVPVAKAYSGLSDEEIRRLDKWIRANTREKFGIVRSVEPEHVFELAFEGIAASSRHKSGIALRFPRIKLWRSDKRPREADTLESLRKLLDEQRSPGS
jgi:DNA ligase 1